MSLLRGLGIAEEGRVSQDVLADLLDKKYIWTEKSGLTPGDEAGLYDADLLHWLIYWSTEGGASGLEARSDRFDRIFSGAYLDWLATLPGGGRLALFEEIARGDFEALATPRLAVLRSPLHRASVEHYDDGRLLWRLAQVVGRAAWQVEAGGPCPTAWNAQFRVLARLHEHLKRRAEAALPDVKVAAPPAPSVPDPRHLPWVRWDVDGQRVVAVLPERTLGSGQSLAWEVKGEGASVPEQFPFRGGVEVREAQSAALGPRPEYVITTRVQPGGETLRVEVRLPAGYGPLVLFSAEGRLLPVGPGESHPPGSYLAMAPRAFADAIGGRRGVRDVQPEEYAPNLWHGWRGFRLELDDGADLAPYRIEGAAPQARWRAEDHPFHGVMLENSLPVWIGAWPRLRVEPEARFAEGLIEVEHAAFGPEPSTRRVARVGTDVPLGSDREGAFLDLGASPALREVYGTVRLACRFPSLPDQPPLVLRMLRVRPIDLDYAEDPCHPDRVAAVRVRTAQDVAGGPGTAMETQDGAALASASRPFDSPSVTLSLPESRAELRVRIPLTRVRMLPGRRPPGPWEAPGVLRLRLREIELEDRLQVELHLGAELERGRLFCRLVGGDEVAAGEPARLPHTFDIRLNRWLDVLGPDALGTVQVRGRMRWIDLVRLDGPTPPARREPDGDRPRLLAVLDLAAAMEDWEGVGRAIAEARERAAVADADGSAAERECMRLAEARALAHLGRADEAALALAEFTDRDDLHEARVLRAVIHLRGGLPREEVWRQGESLKSIPAEFPLKGIAIAEHFAHFSEGLGDRYWVSARRYLERTVEAIPADPADGHAWSLDRKEGLLLDAMAAFRLGRRVTVPDGVPDRGQWAWLPRLAFAADRVTSPGVGSAAPPEDLPRPPLLRERDVRLVRLVLHQAAGQVEEAARLLDDARAITPDEFFAIDLLRFRQDRLEGRLAEARAKHQRCVAWARENHDTLYQILIDEYV